MSHLNRCATVAPHYLRLYRINVPASLAHYTFISVYLGILSRMSLLTPICPCQVVLKDPSCTCEK